MSKYKATMHRVYDEEFRIKVSEDAVQRGLSILDLVKKYDVPESTVAMWIRIYKRDNGIKVKKRPSYSPVFIEKIVKSIMVDGEAINDVAKKHSMHRMTIYKWVYDTRIREFGSRPKKHHTPEFMFNVALHAMTDERSYKMLSKEFGVNATEISMWKRVLEDNGPKLFEDQLSKKDKKVKEPEEKTVWQNIFGSIASKNK